MSGVGVEARLDSPHLRKRCEHESRTWQGDATCRSRPFPTPYRAAHRRDHRITSTRHLRLRPAPLRGDGALHDPGDILGHEPMGIVEEVGSEVTQLATGDRVVIPFNISCGPCFMCDHGLQSQCETTQVREQGTAPRCSATRSCTGRCRAARPSTCGCPRRNTGPSRFPTGPPTTASSTSPTCCRRRGRRWSTPPCPRRQRRCPRARADRRHGRPGRQHRGAEQVIGVDLVPERLARARARGVEVDRLDGARRSSPRRSAS